MRLLYLPSVIILLSLCSAVSTDPVDNIASYIRQGNVHQLSVSMASSVELAVMGDENIYSQTQASLVLSKFFNDNKPLAIKMLHKVNSNPNYFFAVLSLTTDKGIYRVTFTLNKQDELMKLIDLHIEAEKTK